MVLLNIVLARCLPKSEYGLFAVCMTALIVLSMLVRFGSDSALLRFGGAAWQAQDRPKFNRFSFWAIALTCRNSLAVGSLGWIVLNLGPSTTWDGSSSMQWLLVALLPWSTIFTISFILKACNRPALGSLLEVGMASLLTAVWVAIATWLGRDIRLEYVTQVLLICSAIACVIGITLLYVFGILPKVTRKDHPDHSDFSQYCRNAIVIALAQLLANWGTLFYLYYQWGTLPTADFNGAARFAAVTVFLVNLIVVVVAPRLSGLSAHGELEKFRQLVQRSSLLVSVVTMPILLTMVVAAPWVLLILGPKYATSWPLLSILAAGQLLGSIASFGPTALLMSGHEKVWRNVAVTVAISCVALAILLCHFWGAWGTAIGVACYQALYNWAAVLLARQKLGVWALPNLTRITSGRTR
ncbi:MAG: hypothetical protein R3C53_13445 [Pirellulaceae bacterium]